MLQINDLKNNEFLSEVFHEESGNITGGGFTSAAKYYLLTSLLPVPNEIRPFFLAHAYNILLGTAPPIGAISSP